MPNKSGFNFVNSYEQLPTFFYTKTELSPATSPKIVQFNERLAKELALNADYLQSDAGVQVLSGSRLPNHSSAIAQAYAGHQFGQFTMLGDGRALLLGEQMALDGRRFDVQLKGSGPTRYSRGGDGRAALGPMLREYLISEAMHGLGIPTTRGLAVTMTGDSVLRERPLSGAVLTRIAVSHLRVGTFQYAIAWGSVEQLKVIADYAIQRHDPNITSAAEPYLEFLLRVIDRQASLIAKWQLVGFVHGVMNTDNMTISGETIDYGPCAFIDQFDPKTVFSSIDDSGRYAFGNQPHIGKWNLARLAETLIPLLHEDEDKAVKLAEETLTTFDIKFTEYYLSGMLRKLGLFTQEGGDVDLVQELLNLLEKYKVDYTNFFVKLTENLQEKLREKNYSLRMESERLYELGIGIFVEPRGDFKNWLKRWRKRLLSQDRSMEEIKKLMQRNNPAIIPRNHFVEKALMKAVEENDYTLFEQFLTALAKPYDHPKIPGKFSVIPKTKTPYRTFCGT